MKDFTYAIITILGAILLVVGIDAYLLVSGSLLR